MTAFLPDQTRICQLRLRTAELERALSFYRDVLGLTPRRRSGHQVVLPVNPDGQDLIVLVEDRKAAFGQSSSAGLYYFGLRYSTRQGLALTYQRLLTHGYPVEGLCDHGVSEAICLKDPDGNGLELYADRPNSDWPRQNSRLRMAARPLSAATWLKLGAGEPMSEPGPIPARVGSINLRVTSLVEAERFYGNFLGLTVTQRSCPGALFFAAGGYHHHIGVNTWGDGAVADSSSARLVSYRLEVPIGEILYCLQHRAPLVGYETRIQVEENGAPVLQIRDPGGIWLEVQARHRETLTVSDSFGRCDMVQNTASRSPRTA